MTRTRDGLAESEEFRVMSGISSIGSGHGNLEAVIRHASRNTVTLIPFRVPQAKHSFNNTPFYVIFSVSSETGSQAAYREYLTRSSLVTNWKAHIGAFV